MAISKEQMDELAGVAGQSRSKGPRMDVPTISFDGKQGELKMRASDSTIHPVPFPAEFVILKKRNALKAFPMFSTEYDYASTIISLFSSESGRVQHIASGTPPQLRAQFPTLKWMQPCYALYNGAIVKLEIKGASASSFIDYTKTLKEAGEHSYQVVTVVPGAGTGKKGVIDYKFMQFEKRDITDDEFMLVKDALKDVTEQLYNIDKYYAEKKAERAEGTDALPVDDVPVHPLDSEFNVGGEEINPEDIPF